jgi:mannose-6-phosphate isomerase-like protein (cupin superfamily)
MVIKGSEIQEINYRKGYDIKDAQKQIGHFAERVTTPNNPFEPQKHGEQRYWYILEGEAEVTIDHETTTVKPGDLILVAPWTDHSLRAGHYVRWLCFG